MSNAKKNQFFFKSVPEWYLQPENADIHFQFKCGDQTVLVPAHKYFLAANSSVFKKMFFGPMKEKYVVEIIDADENAFKEFLQFFYRPDVTLTMAHIESVAQLTDKYDMLECLDICVEFLMEKSDDADLAWVYHLALLLNNQKLKEFCETEISMITRDVFKSDAFLQCSNEVIKNILQLKRLNVYESEIFYACIAWAETSCKLNGLSENNPENLKEQLGDCFQLIQFKKMYNNEIDAILAHEIYGQLFTRDEMIDILRGKLAREFTPEIFKLIPRSIPGFKLDRNNQLLCTQCDSMWFSSNAPVLLHRVWFTRTLCTLSPTILIRPKKMYEVDAPYGTVTECTPSSVWISEVKLDETITIKFHHPPLDSASSFERIKMLKFYRTK